MRVLGLVVLFVIVVVALLVFLHWYVAPTKPSERKDLVLALAQILGGTALLSGLYFTWRTLKINREGQITERFTRAIEQLGATMNGDKNMEMRLGGIYALARITRESPEDHWPIMEILTAYLRQHARLGLDEARTPPEMVPDPEKLERPPDVQAIVSIIRNRSTYFHHGEPDRLKLSYTNLSLTYLEDAHLESVDLEHSRLWWSYLNGAHLDEAALTGADLRNAFLENANLIGATLHKADLGAMVEGANLNEAKLGGADLRKALGLTQDQLDQAYGNEDTQIPDNLERPASWAENPDDISHLD